MAADREAFERWLAGALTGVASHRYVAEMVGGPLDGMSVNRALMLGTRSGDVLTVPALLEPRMEHEYVLTDERVWRYSGVTAA